MADPACGDPRRRGDLPLLQAPAHRLHRQHANLPGRGVRRTGAAQQHPEQNHAQRSRRHRPGDADQLQLAGRTGAPAAALRTPPRGGPRQGPRERRRQQRLHHDHRRSPHLQGRRAARRCLRRRVRQAPAHPLPAGGERGDRRHPPPADPHRSWPRRRCQGQGKGEGGWCGGRCGQRRRDRAGRQPRQQDQPARRRSGGRGRAGDQLRQDQGDARLADARNGTRSSASCSASCWPLPPPSCSAASTGGCARWRASRRPSGRRCSARCPRSASRSCAPAASRRRPRGCWSRCGACTPRCSSATCSSATASARRA